MSLPVDIDEYSRYITLNDDELTELKVNPNLFERIHRLRGPANKEFMRWKINKDLEEDLKAARRAQNYRAVAAIEKNRILNNRTDKNDEIELEFDKIVPQLFEPTDDPSVIGIEKIPRLRERIKLLNKKYSNNIDMKYTDYEEVEDDTAEI